MGNRINVAQFDELLAALSEDYTILAPNRCQGAGAFSDTDRIMYGPIEKAADIEWDEKSSFTFKEAVLPTSEVLFYFTEDEVKTADPEKKKFMVFLRSCDLHAVRRLDEIYLNNGPEDSFYKRRREGMRFILMGCPQSFENCFCVSMGTNVSSHYDAYVKVDDHGVLIDSKWDALSALLPEGAEGIEIIPDAVSENAVSVDLPKDADLVQVAALPMWDEYNSRCIECGRCNFSCPTCTCFTMQDVFYKENGRVGERRRVWASCEVDGYTEMAGGHCFRKSAGERMRFKVMHKVSDYKDRFGYDMCVGCGRCDDVCPEYISFSNAVNKLTKALAENPKEAE